MNPALLTTGLILPLIENHSDGLRPHAPPYLGAILVELSALMACNDALAKGSPNSTGDLGVVARDLHVGLVVVCVGQQMSGPGLWSRALHLNSSPEPQHRLTNLARIPQVEEAHEALVAHLLVRGEHDDVAPEVKATGPDC